MLTNHSRSLRRLSSVVVLLALAVGFARAQQQPVPDPAAELAEWVKANYTKYEYRIPMRDGIRLFTAVYVPKDATASRAYPVMLIRTPYSVAPYGSDNFPKKLGPSEQFTRSKYIFAYQDVRGRLMSEGLFMDMRPHNPTKKGTDTDEASDTYDTIDWLVGHLSNHNGKVGMWGISYPELLCCRGHDRCSPGA